MKKKNEYEKKIGMKKRRKISMTKMLLEQPTSKSSLQLFQPSSGGRQMARESIHTMAIVHITLCTVRLLAQFTGCVMARYLREKQSILFSIKVFFYTKKKIQIYFFYRNKSFFLHETNKQIVGVVHGLCYGSIPQGKQIKKNCNKIFFLHKKKCQIYFFIEIKKKIYMKK